MGPDNAQQQVRVRNTFLEVTGLTGADAPRRELRRAHTDGEAHDSAATGDLALSAEAMTLNPEARMEQDAGIPLPELRRLEARAEDAGATQAVRARTGAPSTGSATGGGSTDRHAH